MSFFGSFFAGGNRSGIATSDQDGQPRPDGSAEWSPFRLARIAAFALLTMLVGLAGFPSSAQDTTTSTTAASTTSSSDTTTTTAATSSTAPTTTTTASTTTQAPTTTQPAPTTASSSSTSSTAPSSTTTSAPDTSMPAGEEAREDSATGSVSEDLAGALSVWNKRVRDKEVELETAEASLTAAESRLASTTEQIRAIKGDLASLEVQVTERAISAFKDQDLSEFEFVGYEQVQEATRMKTLLQKAVNSNFDVAENLRAAQEDLAIQQAIADDATEEADAARAFIADELVELEKARDQKASLTAKAAASLGVVTEDDIVTVRGMKVHRDIADAVDGMLGHAASEGINLGGGGYRSFESQVEIRKNNCGTSYYAVWQMPSRQCRPPTARPGASQHERGMAMDFTCDGALIRSRSSRCFQWLANNAGNYGFKNLPSEPWHWSVNGR